MKKRYFGTDGMRGKANVFPMTYGIVSKMAMAAGVHFSNGEQQTVVIGKDTRRSSYMFENALTAGFLAVGVNVRLLGPAPTPAVPVLTRSLRANYGIMISASHNPHYDNGIKLFRPDGTKLSEEDEAAITALMDSDLESRMVPAEMVGEAKRIEVLDRYTEAAKRTVPAGTSFRLHQKPPRDALRVALDCSNGAAYKAAPQVLRELGAEVIPIGVDPNGFNINDGVGSMHPGKLQEMVLERRADLGIALDGDADRVLLVTEAGEILDGDQVIAAIVRDWHEEGRLAGNAVVGTIMSGLGLERYCRGRGLDFHRTPVGDRFIGEKMRELGVNIGGEQSGHIILSDFTTTGDGLIAALQVLGAMARTGLPASEVCNVFTPLPRVSRDIPTTKGRILLEDAAVKKAISDAESLLGEDARLVVRASGTEPKIRVYAEGEQKGLLNQVVDTIEEAIEAAKA